MTQAQPEFVKLTEEQVRARKRRNVAIAMGLLVFIATVYAITVSRMHANNEARKVAEAARNAAVGAVPSAPTAQVTATEQP